MVNVTAEDEPCEDCLGSGGQRDQYGDGNCAACGGRGRIAANREAEQRDIEQERLRRQDRYDRIRLDTDEEDGYSQ